MSASAGPFVAPSGPTEPLPPVPIRRWSRTTGFAFFVLVYSFVCFWTCLCGTAVLVSIPFTRNGLYFFRLARLWASVILRFAGAKVEVHLEAPPPGEAVIFVCNHQSMFDVMALFVGLPRPFVFVAKKSVFRYPFMGWAMDAMGYIPVDRGDRTKAIKSLDAASVRMRAGLSVTVFPEGTRSRDGSVLPFKKGPFMLAIRASVPLVPVALEGSLQVNPKRRWYLCPNTVRVLVGPPCETVGLRLEDRDALIGAVRSNVIRMARRLGGIGGDDRQHIAAAGLEGIGRAAESSET